MEARASWSRSRVGLCSLSNFQPHEPHGVNAVTSGCSFVRAFRIINARVDECKLRIPTHGVSEDASTAAFYVL